MLLGIVAGLGVTKLSALTLIIVLCYVIWQIRYRHLRIRLPFTLYVLIGCIALTAVWSISPGKPIWLCLHIITAYLAYQAFPCKHVKWGLYLIVGIQIGVILWQYTNTDVLRPAAFARNASVLGLAAMWGMPGILSALLTGLSISRTAILGVGLFALTGKRYILPAIIALATFLAVTLLTNPQRISIKGLEQSKELRITAITGTTTEIAPNIITRKPVDNVEWRWYGYGYGQYTFVTGKIQPHNIFVRTWYEMGLLTIPAGYCLIYLWACRNRGDGWRNHDWRLLLVAGATGMLTDDLLGSVEGVYMMLTYAIMNSSPGNTTSEFEGWFRSWLRPLRPSHLLVRVRRMSTASVQKRT